MAQSEFGQSFFLFLRISSVRHRFCQWHFSSLFSVKSPPRHWILKILHFFRMDMTRMTSIRRFRSEQCLRRKGSAEKRNTRNDQDFENQDNEG